MSEGASGQAMTSSPHEPCIFSINLDRLLRDIEDSYHFGVNGTYSSSR